MPSSVPSELVPLRAFNVDDHRVVELALILNLLDHAADFMVGVSNVGGEDFDLADVKLFLDHRK